MAAEQKPDRHRSQHKGDQSGPQQESHAKPSVEYNLEHEPLQTGKKTPSVDLRTRCAMMMKRWGIDAWSFGSLVLLAIVLLVICLLIVLLVVYTNSGFQAWTERVDDLL